MNNAPCFLVGAERSGSTMLRLLLDRHSAIAWLNEFEYAVDRVGNNGDTPQVNAYVRWLQDHRIFKGSGLSIDPAQPYQMIVRSFLEQHASRCRKPIIGATVHRHFDRLLHFWPDARFIHILRDPRDVARSCIGMGWSGNPFCGVRRWIEAEQTWDRIVGIVPAERLIETRFEQLVQDPTKALSALCAFLGVEFEAGMLNLQQSSTYSPPDARIASQWNGEMSDRELRMVESRVGCMLESRGFRPSGATRKSLNVAQQMLLIGHDRWKRGQFRRSRLGFGLWMSDFVARRLRIRAWQSVIQRRINAITTAQLK